VEAFRAPLDAYHPALKELWGDRFEAQAIDALGELLAGADSDRRPFQGPVSYRILPRVLGQTRRAISTLEEVATISLREVASNPTFILAGSEEPEGRAVSTGGYHNATAAPAIDTVTGTWADLAAIAQRHIVKLHKGEVSLLPDRLLPPGTDYTTGYSTTYLEYVPNQAIEEIRRMAQPTLLSVAEIAASEQDDIAIPAPVAFGMHDAVAERFGEVLAVLGAVCSQALHVTDRTPAPALAPLLEFIREHFPPVQSRRPLGEDAQRLADAISTTIHAPDQPPSWA
jgi:histidine ammonia-lyase